MKMMMLYMRALVLYLLMITWITVAAYQHQPLNFTEMKPNFGKGFIGSINFSVVGNVYPLGYYAVSLNIGNPPKAYLLDIDTGSDLTWVSCDGNQPPPPNPYNFTKKIVTCHEDVCLALGDDAHTESHNNCKAKSLEKTHPCDYTVGYADGTSVNGFLVSDWVLFRLRTGGLIARQITFGCGFYGEQKDPMHQSNNDGVLGLGKGGVGILNQLRNMGVTENIVGHCLSGKGGGHISFGDFTFPGIVWRQMTSDQHYFLGSADIMFDDHVTYIRGLHIVFDTGSTYTYLNHLAYETLLKLITKNLTNKLKRAPEDKTLPVCWKGAKPFKSVDDVTSYFWNLALSFAGVRKVEFLMHPNSYLIISGKRNVCLGILDGGKAGLGDLSLIGAISMHDKWVIYDNEYGKVGWVDANCNV